MARKAYDTWKIEITGYNRTLPYYVQCDCGKLAQKKYERFYFECGACKRKYGMQQGQYVELKN